MKKVNERSSLSLPLISRSAKRMSTMSRSLHITALSYSHTRTRYLLNQELEGPARPVRAVEGPVLLLPRLEGSAGGRLGELEGHAGPIPPQERRAPRPLRIVGARYAFPILAGRAGMPSRLEWRAPPAEKSVHALFRSGRVCTAAAATRGGATRVSDCGRAWTHLSGARRVCTATSASRRQRAGSSGTLKGVHIIFSLWKRCTAAARLECALRAFLAVEGRARPMPRLKCSARAGGRGGSRAWKAVHARVRM